MSGRPTIYRILGKSWVFSLSQILLAPGNEYLQRKRLGHVFSGVRGLILDVGCGPSLTTPAPDGVIVGVDLNPAYVESYSGGSISTDPSQIAEATGRKRFGFVASADQMPFSDGQFDEARCRFLLHHVPDESAVRVIREMYRCTRPGGRVLVIDGVWPRTVLQNPVAWLLRKMDRGEFMRTEEQLKALAARAWDGEWSAHRYTYTFNGLEGVVLQLHKADA